MRKAGIALVGAGCVFTVLAACVGGPGPLPDQGGDQAGQGGGIQEQGGGGSASTSTGTAAKSNTQTIKASEFDRSCTADTDCVAVFEGLVCTKCSCPNAAIAKKDQLKFSTELAKRSADCSSQGDVACGACQATTVGCDPDTKQCAVSKTSIVLDGG